MESSINRWDFIKLSAIGCIGMGLPSRTFTNGPNLGKTTKVGIIGLDTSHAIHFTKILNEAGSTSGLAGHPVVAAYPQGSKTIESSYSRIPKYTKKVKKMGVEIVDSVNELLNKVDVVLLETNDGRRHLEQAMKVFKAGKPMFIDKPLAASLSDVMAIFDAAQKYNVPMFSSSSLRYMVGAQAVRDGKVGQIIGAETYSPATTEKTHPDLYWYGIHGVEILFTVMGTGCKKVRCVHTEDTDLVVGTWNDGRIGTFRGRRSGKHGYGGLAFGAEGVTQLGPFKGYQPIIKKIIDFFQTGKAPVDPKETKEIYAFMSAAEESKQRGGDPVSLEKVFDKAKDMKTV